MIAIVDYGSGNIQAIKNIYNKLKVDSYFAKNPEDLSKATHIILPGVGAFDEAMTQLNESGMREALDKAILIKKIPVLGVCVGMQIMANKSDEGELSGLGWFNARVRRFDVNSITHKPKIPHLGWNEIEPTKEHPIMNNIDNEKGFYFLHSYYFDCAEMDDVLLNTTYGINFNCAINKGNIFGFQFHPEKSHSNGVNLFENFAGLQLC
ncbi:imidazole glycerol phosphate synthase subunit HisH [Colwellia piezophila]|uniref:imidazole glycerol phosphate synthase subunit HisH n=1 Tax=Colwellia piezophila TaxID=211668 RepID=UPI00037FD1E5|nr:imidazole glycerol phosphate synthase subunit HisH [Colwellia piezophila]